MNKTIKIEDLNCTEELHDGEYIRVCKSSELGESKGIRLIFGDDYSEIGDLEIALIKSDGKYYAVSNICPHKHAPKIAEGIIRDGCVTCPLHGWKYDLETGCNTNTNDGIKKLDKYSSLEKDGWLYIKKPEIKIPAWRTAEL